MSLTQQQLKTGVHCQRDELWREYVERWMERDVVECHEFSSNRNWLEETTPRATNRMPNKAK
ncbi:MAG: hypothetical protein ACRC10_11570 [Thermoguttaceae bacterium]